jgi:hypothetical protein
MLIVCMPRIKLSYIRPQHEYIKPMPLLYKLSYTEYCLYTEDYIDCLVEQQRNNPTPQAINWGHHTPLEEVFIIKVHLIFSF